MGGYPPYPGDCKITGCFILILEIFRRDTFRIYFDSISFTLLMKFKEFNGIIKNSAFCKFEKREFSNNCSICRKLGSLRR